MARTKGKGNGTDYANYLVLYSGGADSTYVIQR